MPRELGSLRMSRALVAGLCLAARAAWAVDAPPVSVSEAKARLSSSDASARAEAACRLGQLREQAASAIPALVAILGDATVIGPVECGMSHWLRQALLAKPEEWRKLTTSPGREASMALARMGKAAQDPLIAALRASAPRARANAAYALGEIAPRSIRAKAVPPLVDALRDDEEEVRDASAHALGEIESPEAVEPLLGALRDSAARVRATSAWALGEIEDRQAVDGLAGALKDEDAQVRSQAAWALGEIADPRAAAPLAGALKDPSVEVRKHAAWALGEMTH